MMDNSIATFVLAGAIMALAACGDNSDTRDAQGEQDDQASAEYQERARKTVAVLLHRPE
jgi:hypothetical protein